MLKRTLTLIVGMQMAFGNVCLMGVAFAADSPTHTQGHGMHAEAHDDCAAESCDAVTRMDTDSDHEGCRSGNCYAQAYQSDAAQASDGDTRAVPAILSPFLTQVLLVLGPQKPYGSSGMRPPPLADLLVGIVVRE